MAENEWLSKDFYKVLGVSKDATDQEIVDTVVEAGYRIGDRVIRAARVVVASPQA